MAKTKKTAKTRRGQGSGGRKAAEGGAAKAKKTRAASSKKRKKAKPPAPPQNVEAGANAEPLTAPAAHAEPTVRAKAPRAPHTPIAEAAETRASARPN